MDAIPIARFGKDHWALLGYVRSCCVERRGVLEPIRMRCHRARHPEQSRQAREHVVVGDPRLPQLGTHLRGAFSVPAANRVDAGFLLPDHDDWDCLADFAAAGLLHPFATTPRGATVRLTVLGVAISNRLHAHYESGGQAAGFNLPREAA